MANKDKKEVQEVKVDMWHMTKKGFKYLFIIWGVCFVFIAGILAFLFI